MFLSSHSANYTPKHTWKRGVILVMFLPATRKEMQNLGWDALDIIIVSGDSYMDNPFMGTAVIGSRTTAWDPVADWRLAPDLAGDYRHPLAGAGISHLISSLRGLDVDQSRNLAKSVTVE